MPTLEQFSEGVVDSISDSGKNIEEVHTNPDFQEEKQQVTVKTKEQIEREGIELLENWMTEYVKEYGEDRYTFYAKVKLGELYGDIDFNKKAEYFEQAIKQGHEAGYVYPYYYMYQSLCIFYYEKNQKKFHYYFDFLPLHMQLAFMSFFNQ